MTIQTDSRTTSEMLTDGSNKAFYFNFPVFKGDNGQKGVEVRFMNNLGFDVVEPSLFAVIEDSDNSGGIIQFYEAPEAGKRLVITGNTPVDQQLDITNYNRFHGASIETNFDKIIAIAQEFLSKLNEEIRQRINNNLEIRDYADKKLSELQDWAISQLPDIAKSQFNLMLNDFKSEWQKALDTITLKNGVPSVAVIDANGKTQQEINDDLKSYKYANIPDARKYPIIADKVTDNTEVIYQAIRDMKEGSELFIPPNVKWDNSPANVYPLMKNYTRIEDHSGYDSRYPNVWHHHVMTYQHTTENTGTTNGNGIINRGDYHPYFGIVVDTPDGGAGSRGSLIIRQDGEDFQFGSDKTNIDGSCLHISTYGDIVKGSKALRIGTQKSTAPHCFAFNSTLITDTTYIFGKHLKRPVLTDAQHEAASHSTRYTQPANHTGSFIVLYMIGTSEKFRQAIDKDGNLTWRSGGSTARLNFDNSGALSGYIKKNRVGNISAPISNDDSHSFFSNFGATGGQSINLPTPKAGFYLEISVDTAQNVVVTPAAGTSFVGMVVGKTKTSNTVGSKLKITGLNSTTWSFEQIGAWEDQV